MGEPTAQQRNLTFSKGSLTATELAVNELASTRASTPVTTLPLCC